MKRVQLFLLTSLCLLATLGKCKSFISRNPSHNEDLVSLIFSDESFNCQICQSDCLDKKVLQMISKKGSCIGTVKIDTFYQFQVIKMIRSFRFSNNRVVTMSYSLLEDPDGNTVEVDTFITLYSHYLFSDQDTLRAFDPNKLLECKISWHGKLIAIGNKLKLDPAGIEAKVVDEAISNNDLRLKLRSERMILSDDPIAIRYQKEIDGIIAFLRKHQN